MALLLPPVAESQYELCSITSLLKRLRKLNVNKNFPKEEISEILNSSDFSRLLMLG